MRTLLIFLLTSTLAFAQQMPEGNPEDIGRLQKDEIVRLYRMGGLTRKGPNWSLIVVKKNLKVFIKGVNGSFTTRLTPEQRDSLDKAIKNTDWAAMTANKHVGVSPSAWDGVDIYLSFRAGSVTRRWSNTRFDYSSPIPVLEAVGKF